MGGCGRSESPRISEVERQHRHEHNVQRALEAAKLGPMRDGSHCARDGARCLQEL
jgi:hypothetical protein